MSTIFDVVSVTCFAGLVLAFFQFTDRETKTLVQFVLAGIVFAVANQVGNAGYLLLGVVLIIAGIGYAALAARR